MKDYRGELRVFGLLVFAALVTIVLYQGLSTASVGGDLLGARFTVGGPAALFVTLILIFSWRGLLTFSVEDKRAQTLARPIDKMTLQEAQRAIDDLQSDIEEIRRRREILQAYVEQLDQGSDHDAAMAAIGMRPARRGASG
jgi:hypothetical protein